MSQVTLPVAIESRFSLEKDLDKLDKDVAVLIPSSNFLSPNVNVDPERGVVRSSATSVSGVDTLVEKSRPQAEDEASPRTVKGLAWALVVLAILSSTFLFALDNTVVADVQPAIVEKFEDIGKLPWLSVAFLLGAAATILVWGKLYSQFNAKWLYMLCVFIFEVGSALCGAANNMNALIVGRVIAGVGGAGLYTGVLTLLSATTTMRERPIYLGMTGLTWGAGTVLGPLIGGAFAGNRHATWRWAFYINLVIGGVFVPVYVFLLPSSDPRPGVSTRRRFAEIDFVGTILIIGAFTAGVMALDFGGTTWAWQSGKIIGLFCTSGVLFIIFGLQQVYTIFTTVERRLFPLQFLRSRTMLILFCVTSAASTAVFVPLYFIPLFFQFVRSDSALTAAVRLLPFIVLLVLTVLLNGGVLSKTGFYFPWYIGGGVLVLIGGALMYTVDRESSPASIYGYSILIGVGAGCFIQASFSVAQARAKPEDASSVVGFITVSQLGAFTIALAIANTVFLNAAVRKLSLILPDTPVSEVKAAIQGGGSAFFKGLSEELRDRVLDAVVQSMDNIYILVIVAGALTVVLSLGLKRESLFLGVSAAA